MNDVKIQWHPAFNAAMQIELEADKEFLEFEEEHLLSRKPLQIDLLVIKKKENVRIHKSIGHIFKKYNIIEYKSPDDYVSEDDFYKLLAYGCIYKYDVEKVGMIDTDEISLSFVCSHFPTKMIEYIEKKHGIVVKQYMEGVYYVYNNLFNMQIIISKKLPKNDYQWLQSMRKDIQTEYEADELMEMYEPYKTSNLHQAVMYVIMRANWKTLEVEKIMGKTIKEWFDEEIKESEQKGIDMTKKVFKLHLSGVSTKEIAEKCNIKIEKVEEILK